jgi:hypothetical protein
MSCNSGCNGVPLNSIINYWSFKWKDVSSEKKVLSDTRKLLQIKFCKPTTATESDRVFSRPWIVHHMNVVRSQLEKFCSLMCTVLRHDFCFDDTIPSDLERAAGNWACQRVVTKHRTPQVASLIQHIVSHKKLPEYCVLFIFLAFAPCWYVGQCRRFGETYCLHLPGLKSASTNISTRRQNLKTKKKKKKNTIIIAVRTLNLISLIINRCIV